MRKIEVEITPEGEVQIRPVGYKGTTCQEATRKLEQVLGDVISDTPTSEMLERETSQDINAAY